MLKVFILNFGTKINKMMAHSSPLSKPQFVMPVPGWASNNSKKLHKTNVKHKIKHECIKGFSSSWV